VGAERELTTVLLVHPDTVFHELVSGTLADEFRIVAATTGPRALTLFERHRPAVVVLESDVGDQRAEDLFEQMRGREPELRVVFLADAEDPKRALRLADLGTVLPRRRDADRSTDPHARAVGDKPTEPHLRAVERLRLALRNAVRFRAISEDVARLKDDAARAGTTTSRREHDEAAGAPHSKRAATTGAPRRSPSMVEIEAVKLTDPQAGGAEPTEGPQSRSSLTPGDDKRGRR
jgi:DNA-binding NtrC family response regulator